VHGRFALESRHVHRTSRRELRSISGHGQLFVRWVQHGVVVHFDRCIAFAGRLFKRRNVVELDTSPQQPMSALPPIATAKADIRKQSCPLYPNSGHVQRKSRCLLRANSGHRQYHSITASACASTVGGTMRPRVFAVLRFITSSYLVGACTGRSAGFSPLRMRST
jgi:hypothetical protein